MEFDEAVKKVSEVFRIECLTDFQNKVLTKSRRGRMVSLLMYQPAVVNH